MAKPLPLAETTEPGAKRAVMLGALPTARERHLEGSAHGITAMVEAEACHAAHHRR